MTTTQPSIPPLGPVQATGTLREVREVSDLPLIWNPDCNAILLRAPGDTVFEDAVLDHLEKYWRTGLRLEVSPDLQGLDTLHEATHGAGPTAT